MRYLRGNVIIWTLIAATCSRAQVPLPAGKEAPVPTFMAPPNGGPVAPVPIVEVPEYGAASRFWVQGEYLLWWLKPGPLGTPLVTTDPSQGVAQGSGGLANPTTQ